MRNSCRKQNFTRFTRSTWTKLSHPSNLHQVHRDKSTKNAIPRGEHVDHHAHSLKEISHQKNSVETTMQFSVIPVNLHNEASNYTGATFEGIASRLCANMGMPHQVHSMTTFTEGGLDQCLDLIKEVVAKSLHHAPQLIINMKLDFNPREMHRLNADNKRAAELERLTGKS